MADDSHSEILPLGEEISIPVAAPSIAVTPPARPRPRILLPLIVACGVFMENLDSSVLATSLPQIARSLNQNPIELKLALTSYLLALAVCLPASGWLADRFGPRTIFRLAIVVFAAGSIACGFSQTIEQIVAARILQGIGGSMMTPVGRLIVLRSVPKNEMIGAMAWVMVPALVGPMLGPLIGGFITTYFEWRWIFWINVPIAVLGLVLASIFIPPIKGETRAGFDGVGFALMGLGIAAFVTGSTALGVGVLPLPDVLVITGVGASLLLSYILYSRPRANAILDLSLFRIQSFRVALIGGMLSRFGIGATPFLLPLLLQFGFGMSPFQSGGVTFVSAIGAMGLKTISTPLLRRFGFRQVVLANTALLALFLAAPGFFTPSTPLPLIYVLLLAAGFFRSMQMTSVSILVYVDVPNEKMSQATTLAAVFQQVSVSLGISIGALVLQIQVGRSGTIGAEDFFWPFVTLGLLSLLASLMFLRLPKNSGAEVSGHRPHGA